MSAEYAARRRPTPLERFLAKVAKQPDGCWLWTGTTSHGYGVLGIGNTGVRVHRFSYEHFVGPIPDGLMVCHRCDVRNCVNPDHLFVGDAVDNNLDRIRKGRSVLGSRHPNAKLTEEKVAEIRRALRSGASVNSLAKRHGVHVKTMQSLAQGLTWRHVSVDDDEKAS